MQIEPQIAKLVLAACEFVFVLGRSLVSVFRSRPDRSPDSRSSRRFISVSVVDERGQPAKVTLINETNSHYKTDCWGRANLPLSWAGHEVTVYDAKRREMLRVFLPDHGSELLRLELHRERRP